MEDKGLKKWRVELENHKEMRHKAARIRNIISKRQTSCSIATNCKYLIEEMCISAAEIAEAIDLKVSDIDHLYQTGIVYPYVRANWVRFLHNTTDGNPL